MMLYLFGYLRGALRGALRCQRHFLRGALRCQRHFLRRCQRHLLALLTLLALAPLTLACDSAPPTARAQRAGSEAGAEAGAAGAGAMGGVGAGVSAGVSAGAGDEAGAGQMGGLSDEARAALEVAFVEVDLVPYQALYTRQEPARLSITCYNTYGDQVPTPPMVVSPRPLEVAAVGAQGDEVTFLQEGQGALSACVRLNRNVCGRVSFYVDDAPPTLTLTRPTPDEVIMEGDAIIVEGRAEGQVAVLLNDELLEVDAEGRFSASVPARFGYNPIEVAADDGVRRPMTKALRAPLYAPRLLPVTQGRLATPLSAFAALPQGLLDGPDPAPPQPGEPWRFSDLAHPLEAVLADVALEGLFDPQVASGESLSLQVTSARIGAPEVSLWTVDGAGGAPGALELFVRFGQLTLTTEGGASLEGIEVGLGGEVEADVSAFISLAARMEGGALSLMVRDVGVALESLEGRMEDPLAQALLDTLTSALRVSIGRWLSDFAQDLVEGALPQTLEQQLGGALTLFEVVPLSFEDPELGARVDVEVTLALQGGEVMAERGVVGRLEIGVSGPPDEALPPNAPANHATLGVPAHEDLPPPWPTALGGEARVMFPLAALNALLFQVWRQGTLNLELSALVPPPLNTFITEAKLTLTRPPLIVDTPSGSASPLALSVEGLELSLRGPLGGEPDRYALSLYVPVGVQVVGGAGGEGEQSLSLSLTESPTLRVSLVSMGGARAVVDPSLVERSVTTLVWPRLEALLSSGLSAALPTTSVALPSTRSLSNLTLTPTLTEGLRLRDGWLILSGGLRSTLSE